MTKKDPRQVVGEALAANLGRALKEELEDQTTGPPMGFALWMIKMLREHLARLESGCN